MFMTIKDDHGSGAGSALNPILLTFAGLSTLVATAVSAMSIYLHLKNYRKPHLQRYVMSLNDPWSPFLLLTLLTCNRMVIRIMLMVPIYAIASLIALFSLEAAFVIDVIRDIYEVRTQESGSAIG